MVMVYVTMCIEVPNLELRNDSKRIDTLLNPLSSFLQVLHLH